MQTIRIAVAFSLLLCTTELFAQKKYVEKIDSILRDRYYRVDIDTDYLQRISGTPAVSVFSHRQMTVNGEREKLKMHFPEFVVSGKSAVVYSSSNWFVGANMVFNFSVNGEENSLQVMNTRWFARSYIGLKF